MCWVLDKHAFVWFWQIIFVCDKMHFPPSDSTESLTYRTCGYYHHQCSYYPTTIVTRHLQGDLVCAKPTQSQNASSVIQEHSVRIHHEQTDNFCIHDDIFKTVYDMTLISAIYFVEYHLKKLLTNYIAKMSHMCNEGHASNGSLQCNTFSFLLVST